MPLPEPTAARNRHGQLAQACPCEPLQFAVRRTTTCQGDSPFTRAENAGANRIRRIAAKTQGKAKLRATGDRIRIQQTTGRCPANRQAAAALPHYGPSQHDWFSRSNTLIRTRHRMHASLTRICHGSTVRVCRGSAPPPTPPNPRPTATTLNFRAGNNPAGALQSWRKRTQGRA